MILEQRTSLNTQSQGETGYEQRIFIDRLVGDGLKGDLQALLLMCKSV
jgi:hypothetical protein